MAATALLAALYGKTLLRGAGANTSNSSKGGKGSGSLAAGNVLSFQLLEDVRARQIDLVCRGFFKGGVDSYGQYSPCEDALYVIQNTSFDDYVFPRRKNRC